MDSSEEFYRCVAKYPRYLTNSQRELKNKRKDSIRYKRLVEEIKELYNSGEGFKSLAKRYNTSYTVMRSFCRSNFQCREGTNVCTPKLREKRRQKALNEHKTKTGWFDPNIRRTTALNTRGVQYWFKKTNGDTVWLRSTYEYIYAKWLERNNIDWKIEQTHYILDDGRSYRPDFFIYENGILSKIVEIKGYWDNNSDKALILNKEMNIEVCVIIDIKPFLEENTTYESELYKWKQLKETKANG